MHSKSGWLFALCACLCIGMTLYPLVSNLLYERQQDKILTEYREEVSETGNPRIEAEWAAAEEYNRKFAEGGTSEEDYEARLDLLGNGIMGYLEIPKIQVSLPVYHGASEAVLARGLGHVPQTSLPVGGSGTHAGITGHTGVSDRRLFTDLDQLEPEDWFYFHVLGKTLAYQVEEILVVLPAETEYLDPISGQDVMTLITCTPYGVNDHRLLVRGVRKEAPAPEKAAMEAADDRPAGSTWLCRYLRAVGCGAFVFTGITGGYLFFRHQRRRPPARRELLTRVRKKRRRALREKIFRALRFS